MKKTIIILLSTIILLTGCQTNALEDYKKALEKTGEIEKSKMNISFKANLDFNKDDLSIEEIRELSYFEEIEFIVNSQYDFSGNNKNIIAKTYINLGGIGFDSIFYMEDGNMYIKMPIIKGYLSLDDIDATKYQNDSYEDEDFGKIINPIIEKWNNILKQEDVFKGKKTYVLTDEGQIKTTTYTINVTGEQLKELGEELIKGLKDENTLETLVSQGFIDNEIDKEELYNKINSFVTRLVLDGFTGIAYVDFDGRLIKQEYNLNLGLKDVNKGEPQSLVISFTMEYLNLGEEQIFDFPEIEENDWLDYNAEEGYQLFLPEIIN